MNILFLTNHLNIGGISSYLLSLTKGLIERGHNIYLASGKGELREEFIKNKAHYFELPLNTKAEISPNVLVSFFKLLPILKDKRIDVIHANTRVTQVLAKLVWAKTGIPFVSTCHGFFKKRFFRLIFPCWGNRVIAISQQVLSHLKDDFKVKEELIRLVRNGIDSDRFSPVTSDTKKTMKDKFVLGPGPVIGIVARLSVVKGHEFLIKAMKLVLQDYPDAQLVIAGEGKIKDDLINLTKKEAIEKQVFFIPNTLDTREVLSVFDIFVLPSLEEGLGLGLMEAMSMELAVIGSNIGGIKSLIQNDLTGFLFESKDIQGMSECIKILLKDPLKRKVLGANARSFIVKDFSFKQMIIDTEKVYLECVNAS